MPALDAPRIGLHRLQKPGIGARINWSNPLARKMWAAFLLNEGAGSPRDLVTPSQTITLGSGATWGESVYGPRISFNNSLTGKGTLANTFTPSASNCSMDVLIRARTVGTSPTYSYILGSASAGGSGFFLTNDLAKPLIGWNIDTATTDISVGTAPTLNVWLHVLFVFLGTSGVIYQSGVQVASGTLANDIVTPLGWIGADGTNTINSFDGDIALLRIWDRALSATEAMTLAGDPFGMFYHPAERLKTFAILGGRPAVAGGITRTITPVTAALIATLTRTITPVTAALQATLTRTITPVTAALRSTLTRTLTPVTAALLATLSRTISASIALQATLSRTLTPVTLALLSTLTRTITSVSVALIATLTRTLTPVTAALQATLVRTVGATVSLGSGIARTISPVTVALRSTLTRTVGATAALLQTATRTITPVTAALQSTLTRVASSTIALQATLSRVVGPVTLALQSLGLQRVVSGTAALIATLTRTVGATVAIAASISQRVITSTIALFQTLARVVPTSFALSQANIIRSIPATVVALTTVPVSSAYGIGSLGSNPTGSGALSNPTGIGSVGNNPTGSGQVP